MDLLNHTLGEHRQVGLETPKSLMRVVKLHQILPAFFFSTDGYSPDGIGSSR